MSGKHWLEREPQDSLGLQRIREAQQTAVLAKVQEAQWVRNAEIRKLEMEQKRLEMVARIEQKTAQVLPVLEEIRSLANATKTFPLGIMTKDPVIITDFSRVVAISEIVSNGLGEIQLQYGFKGLEYYSTAGDDFNSGGHGEDETCVLFGIRLKVNPDEVLLFRRREKQILHPGCENFTFVAGKGGGSREVKGHKPYTEVVYEDEWQRLPDDKAKLKDELAVAFHDPVYLGTGRLPFHQEVASQPEPQAGTGIAGLVKGFLGLK